MKRSRIITQSHEIRSERVRSIGRRMGAACVFSLWSGLLVLSPWAGAHADDDSTPGDDASEIHWTPTSQWTPTSETDLEARRGGVNVFSRETAVAELGAQVSENQVGAGVETGKISLSSGAISEVNGIFLSGINTGNNASVQTNLNVIVRLD